MSTEDSTLTSADRPKGAVESFADYSAMERDQRLNSGEEFNESLFDEAVDLVIRKLQKLEDEGLA